MKLSWGNGSLHKSVTQRLLIDQQTTEDSQESDTQSFHLMIFLIFFQSEFTRVHILVQSGSVCLIICCSMGSFYLELRLS